MSDDRHPQAVPGHAVAAGDHASSDLPEVMMRTQGDEPAEADDPQAVAGDDRRRWPAVLVTMAGLVGLGVVFWLVPAPQTARDLPAAPAGAIDEQWSVVVEGSPPMPGSPASASTTQTSVTLAGGRVLNTIRSEIGRVVALEARDVDTGERIWRHDVDQFELPVLVDAPPTAADPLGQWLPNTGPERHLVGVSFDDGSASWSVEIGPHFLAWVGPDGELFAAGNDRCGFVAPESGDFTFLQEARRCAPAAGGLAHRVGDEWVVVGTRGQSLGRYPAPAPVPRVVADVVVSARGTTVTATRANGQAVWASDIGRTVDGLGQRRIGSSHLAALVGDEQFVFDVATGDRFGPFSKAAHPFVLDGELRLLDDGSIPSVNRDGSAPSSPPPDTSTVRVLDAEGEVLAQRELLLAQPLLLTSRGVLLWQQVRQETSLALYGYDDLAPRWRMDVDGFPTAGLASSEEWVVASYVDRQGRTRLVGLGSD